MGSALASCVVPEGDASKLAIPTMAINLFLFVIPLSVVEWGICVFLIADKKFDFVKGTASAVP